MWGGFESCGQSRPAKFGIGSLHPLAVHREKGVIESERVERTPFICAILKVHLIDSFLSKPAALARF